MFIRSVSLLLFVVMACGAARAWDEPVGAAKGDARTLLGTAGTASTTPLAGLHSLLRSLPTSMFSSFNRSASAATSSSSIDLRFLLDTSKPFNPTQAAIDAAVLSLTGTTMGIVGSTLRLIAGSLNVLGSSTGIMVTGIQRETGREQFGISEYAFEATLYRDINAQISSTDYLGAAARYLKMWNELTAQLATLDTGVTKQMQQISSARSMLEALTSNFAPDESTTR